ncbi:NRDE family protein [Luteimonas huabeiensis]|uniref:NRDE family protein n=1 Tax=Luteimonas huabeiensis TaxID=1244513 RepID=UPI000464583F|nr:NRDE family protein [Luteimonas huabeiensis]
MCLIALAYRVHPRWPLVLIANRDEAHARASAPAGDDPDAPEVYGGRDLVAGGGWLQVSRRGRLAAVTNVRRGLAPEQASRSRGWLVRDFVRGQAPALAHAEALAATAREYGRFNLLLWDGDALAFASNVPEAVAMPVAMGFHAMSNGAFDAAWPKSAHATRALRAWLAGDGPGAAAESARSLEPLFAALADERPAPDAALPDTGVGTALERRLSPAFIRDPVYGTRCSSVVLADASHIVFAERRFGADGMPQGGSRAVLPRAG